MLEWKNRRERIFEKIKTIKDGILDFLCLEEISEYWTYFKHKLSEIGYDSVFTPRPTMYNEEQESKKK